MGNQEKTTTVEAFLVSAFIVGIMLGFIVVAFFAWPPLSYVWDTWDGYWDESLYEERNTTIVSPSSEPSKREIAYDNCEERAKRISISFNMRTQFFHCDICKVEIKGRKKFYNQSSSDSISSYATSTKGNYETYDCYGIKWDKIP